MHQKTQHKRPQESPELLSSVKDKREDLSADVSGTDEAVSPSREQCLIRHLTELGSTTIGVVVVVVVVVVGVAIATACPNFVLSSGVH